MIHVLKTKERYFQEVVDGNKRFEIRNNDRDFQKGDIVKLREVDELGIFTDRKDWIGVITFVTAFEQKDGMVVFGIKEYGSLADG